MNLGTRILILKSFVISFFILYILNAKLDSFACAFNVEHLFCLI